MQSLPKGWKVEGKKLVQDFKFKDFISNMHFINKMADAAEALGHHPDFSVHYNECHVEIWTHSANALTEKDYTLAAKISAL